MERKTICDMSAIPQFDRGMPIGVLKDFDSMLFFGRLTSDGPEELVVERVSGEKDFPVCEPEQPLRLQVALSKNQRYATAYHCQVVWVTPGRAANLSTVCCSPGWTTGRRAV